MLQVPPLGVEDAHASGASLGGMGPLEFVL